MLVGLVGPFFLCLLLGYFVTDSEGALAFGQVNEGGEGSAVAEPGVWVPVHGLLARGEVFEGRVCMTSATHRSGTERVAEIGGNLEVDVVVNLQGDEPMMDPGCIEAIIEPFRSDPTLMISTLKCLAEAEEISDPNVVKVVTDRNGDALYFSRSTIPHLRRQRLGKGEPAAVYKHVGIYAYRREFLEILPDLPDCRLEDVEDLEQLRFLYNGYRIRVVAYAYRGVAVDTPEDLVRINELAVQGRFPGSRAD